MVILLKEKVLGRKRVIYSLHTIDTLWLEVIFIYDNNNIFKETKNKSSSGDGYIN